MGCITVSVAKWATSFGGKNYNIAGYLSPLSHPVSAITLWLKTANIP